MAFATFGLGMLIFMIFSKNNKIFIFISIYFNVLFNFFIYKNFYPSFNDYKVIGSGSSSKEYLL